MTKCSCCGCAVEHVSVAEPVDYEYEVNPSIKFRYFRCGNCGTEQMMPRPDEATLLSFYPADYHAYEASDDGLTRLLGKIRAHLRESTYAKLLPKERKICLFDVGSGDCRHLKALTDSKKFICSGVEINQVLARRGREMGFQIYGGTLESMDVADHRQKYDIMTMYHVLEHVQDPVIVMQRAYSMLREGGYVVGQLPSVDSWEYKWFGSSWAGYHFPRHTFAFSRAGLAELFRRSGFEVIKIRSAPHCQTAISLQNLVQKIGFKMHLHSGRSFLYPYLLFLSLVFEILTTIFDKGGTVDFVIRK